jgi:hypothetical protein
MVYERNKSVGKRRIDNYRGEKTEGLGKKSFSVSLLSLHNHMELPGLKPGP